MRSIYYPALLLALITFSTTGVAKPPPENNPIVGIWEWTLPRTSCSERYVYRSDGTTLVTSAEEIAESEYEIDSRPSSNGFYKATDTLVKDNGKKDCSGEVATLGDKATNFIQFDPSWNLMVVCQKESLDTCFGPLTRVQGEKL